MKVFDYYIENPSCEVSYRTTATATTYTKLTDRVVSLGVGFSYTNTYVDLLGASFGIPTSGSLTLAYLIPPAEASSAEAALKRRTFYTNMKVVFQNADNTNTEHTLLFACCRQTGCALEQVQKGAAWHLQARVTYTFVSWDTGNEAGLTASSGNDARGWYFQL